MRRSVGVTGVPSAILRARLGIDRVLVDLAESSRNRAHLRLDARRQLALDGLDTLADQLTREIDIRAVLEDDRYLRQSVARERARVAEAGQTAHGSFDDESHALLGLERRIARRLRVDLDLDVRDVRHRVDGQALVIPEADGGDAEHQDHDQPGMADRVLEDAFDDHASVPGVDQWSCSAPDFSISALTT